MYDAPTEYFITLSQELSKCVTGTDIFNVVIRCNAVDSEGLKHLVLILTVLAIWSLFYWNAMAVGEFKLSSYNINYTVSQRN